MHTIAHVALFVIVRLQTFVCRHCHNDAHSGAVGPLQRPRCGCGALAKTPTAGAGVQRASHAPPALHQPRAGAEARHPAPVRHLPDRAAACGRVHGVRHVVRTLLLLVRPLRSPSCRLRSRSRSAVFFLAESAAFLMTTCERCSSTAPSAASAEWAAAPTFSTATPAAAATQPPCGAATAASSAPCSPTARSASTSSSTPCNPCQS